LPNSYILGTPSGPISILKPYRKEIDLPAAIDIESAEAVYKNGVLEIKIKKKREGKKSKLIQIRKE